MSENALLKQQTGVHAWVLLSPGPVCSQVFGSAHEF